MKKNLKLLLMLSLVLLMSACGGGNGSSIATGKQGWHFQGRDCLACHNVDLTENEHLLVAGTFYKDKNVSNQDDLSNVCGGNFVINFLDSGFNTIYSSKDYIDVNSKGYNGKGNLFILRRTLSQLSAQTFYVQIADESGLVFGVSNFTHNFTTADYDINSRIKTSNRISCNSCHTKDGFTSPLYAQMNADKCK